jgi:D-alanyl-D-alanine carboxypeptidase
MMLPSGNDAALTLAENFGRLMLTLRRAVKRDDHGKDPQGGSSIDIFVKEMNRVAKHVVHLRKTNYANPHGLAERANNSTAFDQALLASYAMKIPEFAQIVNTKSYTSVSYLP